VTKGEKRDGAAQHSCHARQEQRRALGEGDIIEGRREHGHGEEVVRVAPIAPAQRLGREREGEERKEAEQDAQKDDLRRRDRQDGPLHEDEVGAPDQPEGRERAVGQAEARPASAPGRGGGHAGCAYVGQTERVTMTITSQPLLMSAAPCRPVPGRCTRRTSPASPHRAGRSASRARRARPLHVGAWPRAQSMT